MSELIFSRREAVAALSAATAAQLVARSTPALAAVQAGPVATDAEANALLDSIAENLLVQFPENATSLGIDKGERASLHHKLRDRSGIGQQRIAQMIRADLQRANAVDTGGLSHSTRTSVEVVRSAYSTALEGFQLPYGDVPTGYDSWRNSPYVVIQNVGAYLDTPRFLDSEHQIENSDDAEAYLARLASYPKQLDNELGRVIMARYKKLIPPTFLLDKTLTQLRQSADDARKGGGLVESIERRAREKRIAGNWAARARQIVTSEVVPALERQIAELTLQRGMANNNAGMWARPHGDEYYAWALRASTTTSMSPDEVHAMGLEQVASLQARMDVILKGLGYSKGTVGARMTALGEDPRFMFADGDPGRKEIMEFIQKRLTWIRAQMPRAFNTQVRGNVEVKRLPLAEEPGAPGAYGGSGSIDGTVPGKFWINLYTTKLHNKYGLPTLTHHEAIPGHVWQGEYANKMPLIRNILQFNSYSEGWALYAEQLGDELGAYEGDPVGRLGYLQSISFRACRLVVDTGLHSKRWTRERAIKWFSETNGSNLDEVTPEVERYCSWPGQACGYKVGHSEIDRQRGRAQAALGPKFDLKAFNDAVVLGGNVPMDVLAKNVDEYIATAKSAAA